jgi:hypothetical protein
MSSFGFASPSESEFEYQNQEMANCFHANDFDFPVYRSMAIESNMPQEIVFAASPPVLSKNSSSSPFFVSSKPQLQLSVSDFDSDDDDLMKLLSEDQIGEFAIAHVEELGFSSLSHTTVYFGKEVESSNVTELVVQFLDANDIYSERKGVSKWVCESFLQLENVRFQVQIFSTSLGLAVEFLRLQGCSLSFSSIFRKFGAAPSTIPTPQDKAVSSDPTHSVQSEKESVDALFAYLDVDPVEAVKMICSVLSVVSQCSELLCRMCHLLIERREVYGLLTLATHLNQQLSVAAGAKDTLLNGYDLLVPSLAKYSFDSSLSPFIRHHSSQLMKQRMSMY